MLKLHTEQLILFNIHLGNTRKNLNVKLKPYLLGQRNIFDIINLYFTYLQLKLLITIIIELVSFRQKILIIKERDFSNFQQMFNLKSVFFFGKKWIGGSLTNFRQLYLNNKQSENKDKNIINTFNNLKYMPSFVFFVNINLSFWAFREACNLKIPNSAIIDTDTINHNSVYYPVIGNNKPIETIFFFFNIIKNAILHGNKKEVFKILKK